MQHLACLLLCLSDLVGPTPTSASVAHACAGFPSVHAVQGLHCANTCRCSADAAVDAGGKEEALEAYEEAYNAIFALQLQCHRHTQPHAKHDGTLRWEMIEMWPMLVCKPAAFNHCSPLVVTRVHTHVLWLCSTVIMQWQGLVNASDSFLAGPGALLLCVQHRTMLQACAMPEMPSLPWSSALLLCV